MMKIIKYISMSLILVFLLGICGGVNTASDQVEPAVTIAKTNVTVEEARNGELRNSTNGNLEAWSVKSQSWIDPEAFWLEYAAERGGLTWGERDTYPAYKDVKELDTMIIKLESGICMMEFWHRRWRRANDVRRWDEKFTDYSACPFVFD